MFKKLLLLAAVGLGILYGSGSDLAAVKRQITGTASENSRTFTGGDSGNWGSGSGY